MFIVHWQQGINISHSKQFKMPILFNKKHLKNSAFNMEADGRGLVFSPRSRPAPQLRPLMTLLRLDVYREQEGLVAVCLVNMHI